MYVAPRPHVDDDPLFAVRLSSAAVVGFGLAILLQSPMPMLPPALIVGLIISIFQAATQINEATLSFIPKLVGVFVTLVVAGPWMLSMQAISGACGCCWCCARRACPNLPRPWS